MWNFSREIKVGIFVVFSIAAVGYLALRVDDRPITKSAGNTFQIYLKTATGLLSKSRVQMAGIKVGYIENITLHDLKARVTIVVRRDLAMTTSTRIMLKSMGILGDKFIDIIPGSPDDPKLEDGAILIADESGGTLDDLPAQIGSITADLKNITTTVKDVLQGDGDPNLPLAKVINNILKASQEMSMFAGRNRELMNVLIDNLVAFSENLNQLMGKAGEVNFSDMTNRIDGILVKLENVANRLDQGKGTLGKLLHDEETIDEINTAIRSVNSFVAKSERLKTIVDLNGEYLTQRKVTKNYISLSIQPKQDSFYHFQAVVDPGGTTNEIIENVACDPANSLCQNGKTTKIITDKNALKYSAQFGKRFLDFVFRIGIFENKGGFSVDYYLFDDLFDLTFEAFDLGRAGSPHLKVRARANFLKYFYALAGGDDLIGKRSGQIPSFFLGAGINFTDDDIKSLLGVFSLL